MSPHPDRSTAAGRCYLDLQRKARADGRPVAEYLRLHVLESFLRRLVRSPHAASLVLKGGVLLAAFELRRATSDIDLSTRSIPGDVAHVRDVVTSVAALESGDVDDGVEFVLDAGRVVAETIRGGSSTPSSSRPSLRSTVTERSRRVRCPRCWTAMA